MAVTVKPLVTRLQLRLNTGLDEDFNPIYRTRSYSNIKTDADNATFSIWPRNWKAFRSIPSTPCAG